MSGSNDKILIKVQGSIGVGKSTFTSIIENALDCETVPEPVGLWKNIKNNNGDNMLECLYKDTVKYAGFFQFMANLTRNIVMERAIRNSDKKYIVLDRSTETDEFVFEKMLHDSGMIEDLVHQGYHLFKDYHNEFVRDPSTVKSFHIYLKCDPEVCLERIKKRGRKEEENIQLEYLQSLDKYHNEWLNSVENCIVIDCNEDFEHNMDKQNMMIELINQKIREIENGSEQAVEYPDEQAIDQPDNSI